MAFWDEDDIFPPYYLWAGVDNLLNDAGGADITWTSYNLAVKRGSVQKIYYDNPVGNAIGKVSAFAEAADALNIRNPKGLRRGTSKGAIDDLYWHLLRDNANVYNRREDIPLRSYVFHGLANTLVHRKAEDNIDYNWKWERSQV